MILIVGGVASGKRTFARSIGIADEDMFVVPASYHEGSGALPDIDDLVDFAAIICTDVGSGIVPIDPDERAWRERAGRLTAKLAERADTVVRMVCGIPQYLKGEPWS